MRFDRCFAMLETANGPEILLAPLRQVLLLETEVGHINRNGLEQSHIGITHASNKK